MASPQSVGLSLGQQKKEHTSQCALHTDDCVYATPNGNAIL